MRVLKFGGTSVGSAGGRRNICRLATGCDEGTIVVVSALGGVTDSLEGFCDAAVSGGYIELMGRLRERHWGAIEESVGEVRREWVVGECSALMGELKEIGERIFRDGGYSRRDEGRVVAYGERLSSVIVGGMIEGARHIDSREVIKTRGYFGRHIVDYVSSNRLIKEVVASSDAGVIVMGGFIGSDVKSGEDSNLGRGGSDYTAAVVAAAVGASSLYIYTDVDGFLSADPRIVEGALLIEELGFVDGMELCNFGAKVLYPPTIFPAYNGGIPIVIRNTYGDGGGTVIKSRGAISGSVGSFRGISSINNSALISLSGVRGAGLVGRKYRMFKALSSGGVSIFMVSEGESGDDINIAVHNRDAVRACEILEVEFRGEILKGEITRCRAMRNLAIVAVIGEGVGSDSRIAAQIFGTLRRGGISIITSGRGGTDNSIAVVTELASLRRATQVLHEELFESRYEAARIYVEGDGVVAQSFRDLVLRREREIRERYGVRIELSGSVGELCGARECGVYVDCGGGNDGGRYGELRAMGINVVSANRVAVCENILGDGVGRLKYDSTVGEGLRVVGVLEDLVGSGDTISEVRCALSGFVNYGMELFSGGMSFSEAMKSAYLNFDGEVDVIAELSGKAASERLAIMARSSSVNITDSRGQIEGLLCGREYNGEGIWDFLKSLDSHWEARRQELKTDERYVYESWFRNGEYGTGARIATFGEWLYELRGYDVGVAISSARYREYPLQLRSYDSASSEGVVATRLLSDIFDLLSIV